MHVRDQKVERGPVDVDRVVHVILDGETFEEGVDDEVLPVGVVEVAEGLNIVLGEFSHFLALVQVELGLLINEFRVLRVLDVHFAKLDDLVIPGRTNLVTILATCDRVEEGCGCFGVLGDPTVEELDCTEARPRRPDHGLPDLAVEFTCADDFLGLC